MTLESADEVLRGEGALGRLEAALARSVTAGARALVGAELVRELDGVLLGGVIVEVEAYSARDPASHSYRGPTRRNRSMFAPPGTAYVYRSYGLHDCLNVACCASGVGSAVLIRALAPTRGLEVMRVRRSSVDDRLLCSGPGRLTQALAVGLALDGIDLLSGASPLRLVPGRRVRSVARTPRIGISRSRDELLRFTVAGSPWLSRAR